MRGTIYPDLREVRPLAFAKRVFRSYIADDMAIYAAALSFHALLAIFPFLIFLLALLSFLRIPRFFEWVLEQAETALPAQAYLAVDDVVADIQNNQGKGGLLSFGAIAAFAVASTGVRALMNALNSAYAVPETRAFWKEYVLSFVYTLGLAVLMILAGGGLLLGPQTVEWLSGYIGLSEVFITVWTWLRYPVVVLVLMLAAAVIYYVVPNVDQPIRFITPGAIIAVLAWILASIGFSVYVSIIADYNATYGSLGGIVVLLFYFFISAAVLLLGAEINAEVYELKKGPAEPEDTSGID
jgi:membrane protein